MERKILAICLDCGDTLVDEATEVKNELGESQSAELIPGASEMMQALKERGYRLALVADGPAATFSNNLGPCGLYDLFEVYAISGNLGCEKPDARIFHHAMQQMGIAREHFGRVVMVGNNLSRDIAGANALGMISVWLDWAPRRSKIPADAGEVPAYTIKNPYELVALLDQLEEGNKE
jgi:HAD superfamily hydrolase (TIGR01549 family)